MPFLTALIVFAFIQFVLMLMLRMLNLGPRFNGHRQGVLACYLNRAILLLLPPYVLAVIYSAMVATRFEVWFFLHALLTGILILTSIMKNNSSKLAILGPALLMPMVVMFLSLLINGPTPITQDEGFHTGLAYRIIQDGGWKSYFYRGVVYYQPFPIIPYLEATISMVTGLDMLYIVHPLTVLMITSLVSLNMYIVLKNLRGMQGTNLGVLGPILFYLTPPNSTLGFVPNRLAMTLYLTSLIVLSIPAPAKSIYKKSLIMVILISIVGVITHALYPIFLLLTLIPVLFASGDRVERASEAHLLRSVIRFVTLFSLAYWTYTFILDYLLTQYYKPWTQGLIELIKGEAKPFEKGRPVWYLLGPVELAYSWAFLPAFAVAYISTEIILELTSSTKAKEVIHNLRRDPLLSLGAIGSLLLGVALITRATPGFGFHRYFFPAYILLIPPSAMIMSKIESKKRLINTTIMVIIVAVASFYAIQDPLFSPDVHKTIGMANKRTWNVAQTLVQYTSPDLKCNVDQRVGICFTALMVKSASPIYKAEFTERSYKRSLLVLNLDKYGEAWANYYLEETVMQAIRNNKYNVIYSDGLYKAYYVNFII